MSTPLASTTTASSTLVSKFGLDTSSVATDTIDYVAARALNWARPLLAWAPVQKVLRRLANRSTGPSEEELRAGRSRFWGRVSNAAGDHRTARLETANG